MKTKLFRFSAMLFLVFAAVIMLTACEFNYTSNGYQYFDYDLRGTWVVEGYPDNYLKIDYNTITIHGIVYPFYYDNNLQTDVPMEGYSEKFSKDLEGSTTMTGNIFISWRDEWRDALPYKLWKDANRNAWLSFKYKDDEGNEWWEDLRKKTD